MKTQFYFIFLLIVLSGCSVSSRVEIQGIETASKKIVGKTTHDLITTKGLPSSVVIFQTGASMWVYRRLTTDVDASPDSSGEFYGSQSSTEIRQETMFFLIDGNEGIRNYSVSVE